MTLAEALLSGRSRNFDLLRLGLATAVIVSHAWPLALGAGTPEPLHTLTGRSLGGWAVGGFFFLSGLLITASAERRPARRFWTARARRILPGLGAAVLVTLALAVASGATADARESLIWGLRAVTLVSIEHRLTGAFATNPFPEIVNGPLWSLFHEVAAYAVCAGFVAVGGARNASAVFGLLGIASLAAIFHDHLPARLASFAPLFAAFACGMAAHKFRDHLPLRPALFVAIAVTVWVLGGWSVAMGTMGLALVMLVLRLPEMPLTQDVSFGMYIYGWPVAQMLVFLLPGVAPLPLALLSVLATYPFAVLSWRFIERPALIARPAEV
ncbi:acyltransferase [Shimia sp. SDUM112013]|uniref:acyltransferase family protein n=1 Tax=Shimia sp. SDUM112013 TaxID=3136160 RepID=UPI0032EAD213